MAAAVIIHRKAEKERENDEPEPQHVGDLELTRPGLVTMQDVELCTKAESIKEALHRASADVHEGQSLKWMLSDTTGFKALIAFAVMCNAIQLGVEVDYPEYSNAYNVLDHLFTLLFFAEFVLKLHDLHGDYFRENWNLLDCVLVWLSVLDCWIFGVLLNNSSVNFRSFSVLRILRVARVIRAIRLLRVFRQLWKIVRGILDSVRTVFWAFSLLVLLLYVCSIFCCTMIAGQAEEVGYFYSKEILKETDMEFNVYEFYGTVPRSMYTLFETCIEPLNMRPVIEKQPSMLVFFLGFIFITTFGVLNVIIGVIVDSTMTLHPDDERMETIEVLHKDMERLKTFRALCLSADKNGDGTISLRELYAAMSNPGLQRILEDIHMPLGLLPEELFSLLNAGGGQAITESDMMRQLTRAVVHTEHQQLLDIKIELNKFQNFARTKFGQLNTEILDLRGHLGTLKEQRQQIIQQNEELKSTMQESFSHLLSQGVCTKLPKSTDDAFQIAEENKAHQSLIVSTRTSHPVGTQGSESHMTVGEDGFAYVRI